MPHGVTTLAVTLTFLVAGCGEDPEKESRVEVPAAYADLPEGCPPPTDPAPHEYDAELHDELVAMFERDQSGRTGGPDEEGDQARTERLEEIVAEHGWPGFDLVGEGGEDAAWTIAQHSDLDPEFQQCALALLQIAVDEDQGSPGNLAYLSDRVAVAAGEPQRYGTQVGCGANGEPKPATPLAEPERIEELREEADLPLYEDYLAEMEQICAEPLPGG